MTNNEMIKFVSTLRDMPTCTDSRPNCCNKRLNRCFALEDTRFRYPCPFYKSIEDNEEQKRRIDENKIHRSKTNKH